MPDTVRELLIRITIDASDAIKDSAKFRQNVEHLKREITGLTQAGTKLDDATAAMSQQMGKGNQNARALSTAVRELKDEGKDASGAMSKFGKTMDRVFRIGIGIVVGRVMGEFLQQMREAIDMAKELSKSVINIEVAVRALQRSGVETTIAEWIALSKELSTTFTQFSQADINSAIQQALRLGRQSELTVEQMQGLLVMTAELATLTGQTLTDAFNTAATAVESGYGRGLKETIGVMDKTTLGQEALSRGLVDNINDVDGAVRATVLLALAQEEATKFGEDFTLIQEDISGQMEETTQDIVDQKAAIATQLLPAILGLNKAWLGFLEMASEAIVAYQQIAIRAYASIFAGAQTVVDQLRILQNVINSIDFSDILTLSDQISGALAGLNAVDLDAIHLDNYKEAFIEMTNVMMPGLFDQTADAIIGVGDAAEQSQPDLEELTDDLEKLFFKMSENVINGLEQASKAIRSFFDRAAADAEKFALKISQMEVKLASDIEQINKDFNDKIAESNADFREEELQAEEDFQEDQMRLREDFLLDLEDALHERDARQIMRLIRDFELRNEQLERQTELEQEQSQRQHEQELAQIAEQKDARIAELNAEYALRKQMMNEQFALEQKLQQDALNARLREIQIATQQRNEELLRAFEFEHELTKTQVEALEAIFNSAFGPGGSVENIFAYLVGVGTGSIEAIATALLQLDAIIRSLNASAASIGGTPIVGNAPVDQPGGTPFAEGGTLIADKPTTVTFGEQGSEAAFFMPLNRVGQNEDRIFGGTLPGGNTRSGGGKMDMRIGLSEGLVAEIVDSTMGEIANVNIEVERATI